ncbi:uncharacterized protein RAG0_16456 [Rhynchosporium agropyri]|uniref:Uncharacterized protein n=1 Tax=Rhynchosporium agropyri TaxID=914238 RepID=A0A1E1LQM1_9HELO|nr:uncharacterized protein RAG0_16456 [Rhynchosporium agropyri]
MRSCCLITALVVGLSALTAAQHPAGENKCVGGGSLGDHCNPDVSGSCRNTEKGICLRTGSMGAELQAGLV